MSVTVDGVWIDDTLIQCVTTLYNTLHTHTH
jgi:hypothetical protein